MINLARFGITATNTYFETERFAYFFNVSGWKLSH